MPRPQVFDLFGEIPVTHDEIFDWVSAVAPRWLTPERSYNLYVERWNVAEKIRHAKLDGRFDEVISNRAQPWHARLALDAIV